MGGFVYLWINKINHKMYVGSHIGNVNDGYVGSGMIFNRAMKKYGINNFHRLILEIIDDDDQVRLREQYWIDYFDAANNPMFYNLRAKVGGGFEYINNLPKIRKWNKERLKTRWKELPHPKGFKGKTHSVESKEKTSKTVKKTFKERGLCKPVLQYDLDGNFVARYDSITDAAKSVNGSPSNIKYTIEGRFKRAYNSIWKYEELGM